MSYVHFQIRYDDFSRLGKLYIRYGSITENQRFLTDSDTNIFEHHFSKLFHLLNNRLQQIGKIQITKLPYGHLHALIILYSIIFLTFFMCKYSTRINPEHMTQTTTKFNWFGNYLT